MYSRQLFRLLSICRSESMKALVRLIFEDVPELASVVVTVNLRVAP